MSKLTNGILTVCCLATLQTYAGAMQDDLTSSKWPANKRWVSRLSGGYLFPTNNTQQRNLVLLNGFDGNSIYQQNNVNTKSFIGVGLGAEWHLPSHKYIIWQPTVNFYQTDTFATYGILYQRLGAVTQDYQYQYLFRISQVMFDNKILLMPDGEYLPLNTTLYPYITIGLGGSSNQAYGYAANPVEPTSGPSPIFSHQTNTEFNWSLGFGADLNLTPHLRGGLGYRYVNYGNVSLGQSPQQNTTAQLNQTFSGNQVLAELTFLY